MNLHSRARTCPEIRALLVRRIEVEGWTSGTASEPFTWQTPRWE